MPATVWLPQSLTQLLHTRPGQHPLGTSLLPRASKLRSWVPCPNGPAVSDKPGPPHAQREGQLAAEWARLGRAPRRKDCPAQGRKGREPEGCTEATLLTPGPTSPCTANCRLPHTASPPTPNRARVSAPTGPGGLCCVARRQEGSKQAAPRGQPGTLVLKPCKTGARVPVGLSLLGSVLGFYSDISCPCSVKLICSLFPFQQYWSNRFLSPCADM